MKLLLDNNVSPKIAHALAVLFPEHDFEALRAKFEGSPTDEEWINALHQEGGWAVLTRDLRIRTRPHERAAMDRSRIVFFFLGPPWRRLTVPETAVLLIRLVPRLAAQTELVERGRFELPTGASSKFRPYRD